MDEVPAQNYSRTWDSDERRPPSLVGNEDETLAAFLDWHRETLRLKCTGVAPEHLSDKSVAPSGLSLHGLLRHLAAAERWWFRKQFAGEDVPMLHYSDDDPDQDFDRLGGDPADAQVSWQHECDLARQIVAKSSSLDQTGTRLSDGEPFSLRWLLIYMIAEYARHNGHADLLRERIDGRTGH